jgi:hypothetical protein
MYITVLTKSNPWSRALPTRLVEVRDICNTYTRARNKRVMKRVSNAVMTRECHSDVGANYANVMRIPRRCHCTDEARFICATFEQQMRCKTRWVRTLHALHSTWEARFIAWVTFGQYCTCNSHSFCRKWWRNASSLIVSVNEYGYRNEMTIFMISTFIKTLCESCISIAAAIFKIYFADLDFTGHLLCTGATSP